MAFMAFGLDKISICSSKSAIRFRGTMKATTSPFRVMAEVFPLRHSAGNFACPFVMVNVFFMQILHRQFFALRQVFYLSLVTLTSAKIRRNADSVASSGRLKLYSRNFCAPKIISRKQKGAARSHWRGREIAKIWRADSARRGKMNFLRL